MREHPRRPPHASCEAVPALQGARHPYGLQDALSTLRLSCSPPSGDSASDARLDTGGWLALTRRGLAPRKKRRASLGAITPRFRRAQEPERGTSGGYWASLASDVRPRSPTEHGVTRFPGPMRLRAVMQRAAAAVPAL